MSDLISRQAAINALKNRWKKTRNYEGIGDDIAEECELYLKQLPSAQPVRHGKWLDSETFKRPWFRHHVFECSVCRNTLDMDGVNAGRGDANYCPNCGAKMDE